MRYGGMKGKKKKRNLYDKMKDMRKPMRGYGR